MYRLVIDFPMGENQEEAVAQAKEIAEKVVEVVKNTQVKTVQYRLQYDDDRSVKNYLVVNENGHVGHKKTVVNL